jgi:hypothetical protein
VTAKPSGEHEERKLHDSDANHKEAQGAG